MTGYGKTVLMALMAAALVFASGCASGPYKLKLDVYDYNGGREVEKVWPPAPEKARYKYVGELVGEANFEREGGEGSFTRALEFIAGVITGEDEPVTLQRPQAGAAGENGDIYVTDVSRQAVYVFSREKGLLIWEMAAANTRFMSPIGVAAGKGGEILVTDSELGFVARLDGSGRPVGVIGAGTLKRPTGIARDPANGLIYVADTHAHDIKVFNDGAELVRTIGSRGEGEGALNFPIHLALGDGEIYVTDTLNARVQVFGENGDFIRAFGRRGLYKGEFTRPKGIALDSDGNVYVIESYYDHLLVFDREGRFLLPIGGAGSDPGRFYLPAGVWIDRDNRVFVADMFNRRVVVFQYLGGS